MTSYMSEYLVASQFPETSDFISLYSLCTFALRPSSHMAMQSFLDCSEAQGLVISKVLFSQYMSMSAAQSWIRTNVVHPEVI